jgi:hypothetical protein
MNTYTKGFVATATSMALFATMSFMLSLGVFNTQEKEMIVSNINLAVLQDQIQQAPVFYSDLKDSGTLVNGTQYTKGFIAYNQSNGQPDSLYPLWIQGTTLIVNGYEIPFTWLYGQNYLVSNDNIQELFNKFTQEKQEFITNYIK